MNLYFRLLWVFFRALRRPRIQQDDIRNEITTMVFPNDLDINLHMNNGRFMTICDLGRVDMFVRTGLARVMYQKKWIPVVSSVSMTFIKSLHLFDRVRVSSHVTHWDEKYFYSTHSLFRGDEKVAEGTSKALVIRKTSGRVTPAEVIDAVDALIASRNGT